MDDPQAAESKLLGTQYAKEGERHLAWVKQPGGRWAIVNAEGAGAPFLQRINDPLGDRDANVKFTEQGVVKVIKAIPAADLRAARSLADLRRSELLMRYDRGYWRVHTVCSDCV